MFPEYNDEIGVSEVIIRTTKGRNLFFSLMDIDYIKVSEQDGYQESLYNSVNTPLSRTQYFDYIKNHKISEANSLFCRKSTSFVKRIFRKIKKKLLKNKNSIPAVKHNGLAKYFIKERKYNDFELLKSCCGCSACYNVCPCSTISMKVDSEGFFYPHIDESRCVNCEKCIKVCPVIGGSLHKTNSILNEFYAAKNINNQERLSSSSGGIFSLLAKNILKRRGVVFGAAFDLDFNVHHIYVKNINDLKMLRGSKYVQSDINSTYKQVLSYLKNDRFVLFSGTPCQIAGLKSFLNRDYEKLVLVDVICHGVPSSMVFNKYLNELVFTI